MSKRRDEYLNVRLSREERAKLDELHLHLAVQSAEPVRLSDVVRMMIEAVRQKLGLDGGPPKLL
jgi:hypothetical protein